MSLSMHSASVPLFSQILTNMLAWLDKAQAHAQEKKFDTAVYLTARLAPDMHPLSRQIQMATDTAKGAVARLAGQQPPAYEDTETSLDDLRARLRKTLDFIQSVPAASFEGAETRDITLPIPNREPLKFTGQGYLVHFALPNFLFHATTTYALLRHQGVALGKGDFLGG